MRSLPSWVVRIDTGHDEIVRTFTDTVELEWPRFLSVRRVIVQPGPDPEKPGNAASRELDLRLQTAERAGRDVGALIERERVAAWLHRLTNNDGWSLKERLLLLDLAAQVRSSEHLAEQSLTDSNPGLWK